ncbi:Ssl1-domain-containing protein [Gonapodya prolifera JEL478]|uniref:General transcription and DNA repair factor IIH n=1 Tax=Gonapodya prolifera (strain JEL478) TaxID=1344416 RepID=A0A138ZZK4_GONPJ|nr:Ssl1-domain-containing protein [Gonapodya prolifera JEL478]|eukprot:KXS09934.1 Ssl1-domain-containing protein [Gonapodya prolifera JEL478]
MDLDDDPPAFAHRNRAGAKGDSAADVGDTEGPSFTWEGQFARTWDVVQEDADGSIAAAVSAISESSRRSQLRRRLADSGGPVRRGIVRSMVLVLDLSRAMAENDYRPTRAEAAVKVAEVFVQEFFDQNPLSVLGILGMRNGIANVISEMGADPNEHINCLRRGRIDRDPDGEPSIQNALELVLTQLTGSPPHSTREVLLIFGSLTTWDPGDVLETVEKLRSERVRCSVVGMTAEVWVCKEIANLTGGTYAVPISDAHFRELVLDQVVPPPIVDRDGSSAEEHVVTLGAWKRDGPSTASGDAARREAALVKMGFPKRIDEDGSNATFPCPVCRYPSSRLPNTCPSCSLQLVSAPLLARSYHHIFPLPAFRELPLGPEERATCTGCLDELDARKWVCTRCEKSFCGECDVFVHDALHNCPVRM